VQARNARAEVAVLQSRESAQQRQLNSVGSTAASIRAQLQSVQKQNQQIVQLIGVHPKRAPHAFLRKMSLRIGVLAAASAQTAQESNALERLTLRVLNVRHLEQLARARLIADIPSIDPVAGAPVVGCYCYRTSPSNEFHPGVDLGADWGQPVRAAAAGTVVSANWDGGYGLKIDIDHGNGYHTWYAHLSRADVTAGQTVYKGEHIAEVGSTGFSTGPHLHYQVMRNDAPVDPTPFLSGVPAQVLASLP